MEVGVIQAESCNPDTLLVLRLDPELAVLPSRTEPADTCAPGGAPCGNRWTGTAARCTTPAVRLPEVSKTSRPWYGRRFEPDKP